jgi:hypothetical protein
MSSHLILSRLVSVGIVLSAMLAQGCVGTEDGSSEQASTERTVGQVGFAELKTVAGEVSLGYFGEDSGSYCTAIFRVGPMATFDERTTLELLGFDAEARMAEGDVSFEMLGDDFWPAWIESQESEEAMAAADQVQAVLDGDNATALAVLIVPDGGFSARAYLVAQMSDNSLLGLRGTIGGMGF